MSSVPEIVGTDTVENAQFDQVHQDVSSDHHTLVSPIFWIPSEVISDIFVQCLPTISSLSRPGEAPLVLGRVCRIWRLIAFSTPELWSRFEFTIEDLSPSKEALVEDWFSRSGSHLLSLIIQFGTTTSIDYWHRIFKFSHTRWKNVTLYLGQGDAKVLLNLRLPFYQLRTFTMEVPHNHVSPVETMDPDAFENAPVLRKVTIIDNGLQPFMPNLPWHQITALNMECCYSGTTLKILTQCPNLLVCGLYDDVPLEPPPSPVPLLYLRVFTYAPLNDFLIINHLVLPALDTLTVLSDSIYQDSLLGWYASLVSLLYRSRCPLRTLQMTCPGLTHELAPCIMLTPELVTFIITSPLGRDTVHQLTIQPTGNTHPSSFLLPKLERLSFDCGKRADHGACIDMIRSRWNVDQGDNGISRLRSVCLSFMQELPELAIISQVDELRAEGLEITLLE